MSVSWSQIEGEKAQGRSLDAGEPRRLFGRAIPEVTAAMSDEDVYIRNSNRFSRSSTNSDSSHLGTPTRPDITRSPSSFDPREYGVAPNGAIVASSRRRLRSRWSDQSWMTGLSVGTDSSESSARITDEGAAAGPKGVRKPFPSTKLREPVDKPWLRYPDRSQRWSNLVFWVFVFIGFAVTGYLCYEGYTSVPRPGTLCLVMDDDFSNGINPAYWNHEVQTGGFGNGEFEWTTTSPNNSFVQDGVLYLVPTLTEDNLGAGSILNGYTLNLTAQGICTSANTSNCVQSSNSTLKTIINPVQSARLNTQGKINITYGKVEVQARMPLGDWLWPAIWMLPVDNTYGPWPMSGEIDIAESRGNNFSYTSHGVNWVQTTLHWGPETFIDSWYKTWGLQQNKIAGYHTGYHTFTLEWTENYMTTYIDNRVYTIFDISMKNKQSFWNLGNYPVYWQNATTVVSLTDPWYEGTKAAPFDQSFYLILNLAVGGTNGYFPDDVGGKPWIDSSSTAMYDFWQAKDQWYPTWPSDLTQRGMAVKSVKMWQKC